MVFFDLDKLLLATEFYKLSVCIQFIESFIIEGVYFLPILLFVLKVYEYLHVLLKKKTIGIDRRSIKSRVFSGL